MNDEVGSSRSDFLDDGHEDGGEFVALVLEWWWQALAEEDRDAGKDGLAAEGFLEASETQQGWGMLILDS